MKTSCYKSGLPDHAEHQNSSHTIHSTSAMAHSDLTRSKIHGCHLVGSISGCPDAHTVFTECAKRMPNLLKRFPDGETGERAFFTRWQRGLFMNSSVPQVVSPTQVNQAAPHKYFPPEEADECIARLSQLHLNTRYDEVAIESYAVFKKLKSQGVIPARAKFQVCLPTSANVAIIVYQQFRATAFDVHEAALFRAMRRIQDEIPHEELSIQIDLAIDTALWEGLWETSWHDDPQESQIEYILRMISQVDQDVELGMHNCYGML